VGLAAFRPPPYRSPPAVEQSSSTAVHAFIDGKNSRDRELWSPAASLGWLGSAFRSSTAGSDWAPTISPSCTPRLGRQAAPGPYISTLSAAQAIVESGTDAARNTWLPRIAFGGISAAVPATPGATVLTRSGTGVSGTLRCLGARDAAFVLAPPGGAWVIVEQAGAEVNAMPMWGRTREVIDICLQNAQSAAVLEDPEATAARIPMARTLPSAISSRSEMTRSRYTCVILQPT
jgi:hypothetical protein